MLIRIDDYPNAVRPNSYWSGGKSGYNDEWQEHTSQLNIVLEEFEKRKLPYILAVVPALIEKRDIEYLKSLKYCEVALHGYDHGNVMFKQIEPENGRNNLIYGGWSGVDNEFHPRYKKTKNFILQNFLKSIDLLSDFKIKHFIAPFNHMSQEAVDAVKECGLTDIWWAGNWNYHDLIVHDPGVYERSCNMKEDFDFNKNVTFHLTWELEEYKTKIREWNLPNVLDRVSKLK